MIRFTTERVLLLHQLMIAQTGGSDGLRDMGLLESAVESIYASFGRQELYPSKQEKRSPARICLDRQSCFCRWRQTHWHVCNADVSRSKRHTPELPK